MQHLCDAALEAAKAPGGAGGGRGLGGLWGGGAHAAAPTLLTGSLGNSSSVLKGLGPSHLLDIPSSHPREGRSEPGEALQPKRVGQTLHNGRYIFFWVHAELQPCVENS